MEAAAAEASERAEATAATAATGATAEIVAAAAPISQDGVFTAGYLWRCEEKASAGKNLERKMSWENPIKRFANCLLKVDKKKEVHAVTSIHPADGRGRTLYFRQFYT